MLETRPASPGSWCATWDGNHSTDRGPSGHSWLLPNQWGIRPLASVRSDKELPVPGPELWTKVSFTCLRQECSTAWPWACNTGFSSGRTSWSWATTVRGLMYSRLYSRPKVTTLDAAAIRPSSPDTAWQWVTALISPSWLSWGSTRNKLGTIEPASWSNPTPRRDEWSSVMEKAHIFWCLVLTPSSFMRARTTSKCSNWANINQSENYPAKMMVRRSASC